jgi:hypothetical protein
MTCVPYTDSFGEMWWFDTSTRGWELVDNKTANGAAPSARYGHVMTSVRLDLWLHGGTTYSGDGDSCSTRTVLLLLLLYLGREIVPLVTFHDCVCNGVCKVTTCVCTVHDFRVVCR